MQIVCDGQIKKHLQLNASACLFRGRYWVRTSDPPDVIGML